MKSECNLISIDEVGYEEHPLRAKKRENGLVKKNDLSRKQQKVDFTGHLNDNKTNGLLESSPMKSELENSQCIDELFNQNGSLTHLCGTLDQITPYRKTVFTSSSEEKYSGLGSQTYSDLGKHVYALRTEYIQRLSRPLILKLMIHPSNKNIFNAPVDPVAQGVPNYYEKIKKPMDLGTIRSNVHRGFYKTIEECFADILLVFQNAITFNAKEHAVHKLALELLHEAETDIALLKDKCIKESKIKQSHNCSLCCGSLCLICGEKCLKFETPVLVCQGSCAQKVKKNTVFYITSDSNMLWCQKCYNSLPAVISADYPSPTGAGVAPLLKKQLLKRKSDEEVAEPWVECDDCGFWVHQICALYNDLEHDPSGMSITETDDKTKFSCPLCRLERASRAVDPPEVSASLAAVTAAASAPTVVIPEETRTRPIVPININTLSPIIAPKVVLTPMARVNSCSNYIVEGFNGTLPDCIARTNLYLEGSTDAARDGGEAMDVESAAATAAAQVSDAQSLNGSSDTEDDTTTDSVLMDDQVVASVNGALNDSNNAVCDGSPAVVVDDDYEILDKKDCDPLNDDEDCKEGGASQKYLSFDDAKLRLASMFQMRLDVMERFKKEGQCENDSPSTANAVSPSHTATEAIKLAERTYSFISRPVEDGGVTNTAVTSTDDVGAGSGITSGAAKIKGILRNVTISIEEELDDTESDSKSRCGPLDALSNGGGDNSCGVSYLSDTCSVHSTDDFHLNDANSSRFADSNEYCSHTHTRRHDDAADVHWKWRASALPRTKLSDFLEAMVKEMLTSSGYADAANSITIRMTSNCDHKMDIPQCIVQNMMTADGNVIPDAMGYKQKCILLFQAIDGVDVCLFCLYVQEFDASCPAPNTSTVYIAYLDSVDYFRPMEARTLVYHEIIVAYLKWSQCRGFQSAHIWSCPPQRGDSFIFWCHPSTQRTPSRDRLNTWYNSILLRCSKLGILSDISSLYSTFFSGYNQVIKRDDSQHRLAAKNSFVGSGLVKQGSVGVLSNLTKNKSTSFSNLLSAEDVTTSAVSSSTSASMGVSSDPSVDSVPISPPIFEGDFWILEYLRLTRQMSAKAKTVHGNSSAAHAALGMGRGAGGGNEKANNQRRCRDFLKQMTVKSIATAFLHPVDPVALHIPTYFQVITNPMDLGTVREKLRAGVYQTVLDFAKDIRLTFQNAMLFNPSTHIVHIHAQTLLKDFHNTLLDMMVADANAVLDACGNPMIIPRSTRSDVTDTTALDAYLVTLSLVQSACNTPRHPVVTTSTASPTAAVAVDSSIPIHVEAVVREEPLAASAVLMDDTVDSLLHPICPKIVRHVSDSEYSNDAAAAQMIYSHVHTPLSTSSSVPSSAFSFDFGIEDHEHHTTSAASSSRGGGEYRKRSISHTYSDDGLGMDLLPLVRTDSLDSSYSTGMAFDRSVRRRDSLDSMCSSTVDMGSQHDPDAYLRPFSFFTRGLTSSSSYNVLQDAAAADNQNGGHGSSSSASGAAGGYFSAQSFNRTCALRPFDKIGFQGGRNAMNLVHELSKCVQRLKDDLFVIRFASPSQVASPVAATTVTVASTTTTTNNGEFPVPTAAPPAKRHRGRAAVFIKKAGPKHKPSERIPSSCLALLSSLVPDTSDPDPPMSNSFVNSRHTLLEMSQYRHYQFDSLRRAKHSSLMLIYHLQNPSARCTRVICCQCHEVIRNIRWHCDQCPNYDVCNSCNQAQTDALVVDDKTLKSGSVGAVGTRLAKDIKVKKAQEEELMKHTHPMTPYRVSYG